MRNTTMVAQLNQCVKSIREFKHLHELRSRLSQWKGQHQEEGSDTGREACALETPAEGKSKSQKQASWKRANPTSLLPGHFEEDDVTEMHDNNAFDERGIDGTGDVLRAHDPECGHHGL